MPSIFDPSLTPSFPGGPKAAFGSAVACGILLGVFEGVGVLLGRVFSEGTRPQLPPCESLFPAYVGHRSPGAVPSTRVNGPANVIVCCYLVLIPCSLLHPHPYNYSSRIVHCSAL